MTETVFEKFATAAATLKLDFSSEEFALYAEEHELSETEMAAVERVFTYLSEKKQQTLSLIHISCTSFASASCMTISPRAIL